MITKKRENGIHLFSSRLFPLFLQISTCREIAPRALTLSCGGVKQGMVKAHWTKVTLRGGAGRILLRSKPNGTHAVRCRSPRLSSPHPAKSVQSKPCSICHAEGFFQECSAVTATAFLQVLEKATLTSLNLSFPINEKRSSNTLFEELLCR